MDTKQMLKYAAIAVAIYLAYRFLTNDGDGELSTTVEPQTPEQIAANKKMAAAVTEADALAAANAKYAADAKARIDAAAAAAAINTATAANNPVNIAFGQQVALNTMGALAAKLQSLAGAGKTLNVDGWNFYMRQLNPNAVVTDLSEVGVTKERLLNPMEYASARSAAGLALTGVSGLSGNTGSQYIQ